MLASAKKYIGALADIIKSVPQRSVIIMQGAGISVNAGIPDFRTPVTGFYSRLESLGLNNPEQVFDIHHFDSEPQAFYSVAHEFLPGRFRPTPSHYFSNLLAAKGKLLRTYTQNIDGLEMLAGLPESLLVEAHGHVRSAHCAGCSTEHVIGPVIEAIKKKAPLPCKCGGFVKPDIVFFGEALPVRYWQLGEVDFPECKLLVVLGTSLQVHPFAGMVKWVNSNVPRFLINKEPAGQFNNHPDQDNDFFIQGDCDMAVKEIAERLGWAGEFGKLLNRH
jgi:NAD-dependent SIR2 family protein deacetylase